MWTIVSFDLTKMFILNHAMQCQHVKLMGVQLLLGLVQYDPYMNIMFTEYMLALTLKV